MFDMQKIGKTIVSLRKSKNMTQMELADKLGISFQAVSNWERGNSMPDISKLPELAEIFGVSLDELLGEKSSLVEAAVEDRLEECVKSGEVAEEEIQNVLPILKPKQIQNMAANADAQTLQTFLPFLDEDDVAELAREAKENGQQFTMYLPFMDDEVIAEWAREDRKNGRNIAMYLPFMDEDDVADMAKEALQQGRNITGYLPFMDEDDVKDLLMMVNGIVETSALQVGQKLVVVPMRLRMEIRPLQREISVWDGQQLVADYPITSMDEVPRNRQKTEKVKVAAREGYLNGLAVLPRSPQYPASERVLVLSNGVVISSGQNGHGSVKFRMDQKDLNELAMMLDCGNEVLISYPSR